MSRRVILTKPLTIGHQSFVAGQAVDLPEAVADDVVTRGLGGDAVTSGTATILNGQNSVVVPHGLGSVPSGVCLTGTHVEVASCIVSAANSLNTAIQTVGGANVTADRKVYWGVRR